ncbi:DUF72 domain-containing protein, partial [Chloroflexota bacterium]
PQELQKQDWLTHYAGEFNTCEINSTFYTIPRYSTYLSMIKRVGEDFLFVIKAFKGLTHERNNESVFGDFKNSLKPLLEAGRLGCVLVQFPYSFKSDEGNLGYLAALKENLEGLPLVIEFRHASWFKDSVFSLLRRLDIGFCAVDEPRLPRLMPPVAVVTNRIGYVRFHGRNARKWWQHEHAYERYDYTYTDEELTEWVPKIKKIDEKADVTFVFANNHWRGQSVNTVRQIKMMLE